MSDAELKLEQIRTLVQEWVDKKQHDRCWYYPEIFRSIAEILNVTPTGPVDRVTEPEFRGGCDRFTKEEFKP